jgi:hypothetical protein
MNLYESAKNANNAGENTDVELPLQMFSNISPFLLF